MVKDKMLVDNLLDTSYQKKSITRDMKIKLTPDGPSRARLYGLPKINKTLADGRPKYIPNQTYLKLAFQHINCKIFIRVYMHT